MRGILPDNQMIDCKMKPLDIWSKATRPARCVLPMQPQLRPRRIGRPGASLQQRLIILIIRCWWVGAAVEVRLPVQNGRGASLEVAAFASPRSAVRGQVDNGLLPVLDLAPFRFGGVIVRRDGTKTSGNCDCEG